MTTRRRRGGGRRGPRITGGTDAISGTGPGEERPAGTTGAEPAQPRCTGLLALEPESGADRKHDVQPEAEAASDEARAAPVPVAPSTWPRRVVINGRMHMVRNKREADDIAFKQAMGWPL